VAQLQSGFMEIIFPNLDKASKDAITNQVDPKELKARAVKIRTTVVEHTIGKITARLFRAEYPIKPKFNRTIVPESVLKCHGSGTMV
jgi:hypothetical protein